MHLIKAQGYADKRCVRLAYPTKNIVASSELEQYSSFVNVSFKVIQKSARY